MGLSKSQEINLKYGKEICEEYLKPNILLEDLASKYNCSGYIINRVLGYNNIELKSIYEVATEVNYRNRFKQRHYNLNYKYFDTWSSNMAYILGFIYADGYIHKDRYVLRLNVQRSDRIILEKIKEELEFDGKIIDYDSKCCDKLHPSSRLSIGSMDMIKRLRELGLHSNKSLTIQFPNIPKEYELDFIRGFFDGDGSIEYKRQIHNVKNSDTYQLRFRLFSGSYGFLDSIMIILIKHGLKEKTIHSSKGKNLYSITYSTKESYKLYDLLYKENDLYLERKKLKFEKGFELRDNKY